MLIRPVSDPESLRSFYWELIKAECDLGRFINRNLDWTADNFEQMFCGYWWIYRVQHKGEMIGFAAVTFHEGEEPELCFWCKPKTAAWRVYAIARRLIPDLIKHVPALVAYWPLSLSNRSTERLARALGAEIYQDGKALWAADQDQNQNLQDQHLSRHLP